MSEWISVEDRLPKHKEKLAFVFDGDHIIEDCFFLTKTNKFYENVFKDSYQEIKVTHWMPLPDYPKKEKE